MTGDLYAVLTRIAMWGTIDRDDDIIDGFAVVCLDLFVMKCSDLGFRKIA